MKRHDLFASYRFTNFDGFSHGVTLRACVLRYFGLAPEWFEEEPNPKNCSIRMIQGVTDQGYIWYVPGPPPSLPLPLRFPPSHPPSFHGFVASPTS